MGIMSNPNKDLSAAKDRMADEGCPNAGQQSAVHAAPHPAPATQPDKQPQKKEK